MKMLNLKKSLKMVSEKDLESTAGGGSYTIGGCCRSTTTGKVGKVVGTADNNWCDSYSACIYN